LSEALQIGGRITFSCSGIIGFTRSHALTKNVEIDGGGGVTLDGQGHRMFGMGSSLALRVSLRAIRIIGGGPSGLPGGVISGEGFVALLDGTTVSKSQKPIWLLAGDLDVRNARLFDNTGPVAMVSEGALDISRGSAFTDNTGPVLATGPLGMAERALAAPWRRIAKSLSRNPGSPITPSWKMAERSTLGVS
jgi:hypothetical protein